MDRHLGSLFFWIIISNPQPNSPEVYDFKLLSCCYNKKVHFICLAYYHIKERRHCFLNSNTTRYVIKDRIRKKKKKEHEWVKSCHSPQVCCSDISLMSKSVQPYGWQSTRLLSCWDSPAYTGVGCHYLLQGIFLTQKLNPSLCDSCNGRQVL